MGRLNTGKLYSVGFFAFLCGTVLVGALLGTISFCFGSGGDYTDVVKVRGQMTYGGILLSSLGGTSLFMTAALVFGLCPVGQPFEIGLLLYRGMGLGITLAELYSVYGFEKIFCSVGFFLTGGVISAVALVLAVRESVVMSCIYLRISLSEVQERGLRDSVKLYAVKLLVFETAAAVGAAVDCLCSRLLIGKL